MADRRSTKNTRTLPIVLAVGTGPELTSRCRDAAIAVKAMFEWSDVAGASTAAARYRPLVLVISEDVYEFDAGEFEALARDVRAKVLCADEDISFNVLEPRLRGALREATRLRGS